MEASSIAQCQGVVACKKRRIRQHHTPYIPMDVMYKILQLLPAKALHDELRFVCKEWCSTINDPGFLSGHFQKSCTTTGILVQHHVKRHLAHYLDPTTAGLEVTELRIPLRAKVLGSCNGFVLLHDWTYPEIFHVMNIVTKAKVSLPRVDRLCKYFAQFTAFSYASSGHYKVVHVSGDVGSEVQIMVCTVGDDKAWRIIDLGSIIMCKSVKLALLTTPYYIAGFIYWMYPSGYFILALDVDSETMHRLPPPEGYDADYYEIYPIDMETSFGLVSSTYKTCIWRVWKLIGLESGKWARVADINVRPLRSSLEKMVNPPPYILVSLTPLFMKNRELWIRISAGSVYSLARLNIRKRKGNILLCAADGVDCYYTPYPHVNTLLCLKNC